MKQVVLYILLSDEEILSPALKQKPKNKQKKPPHTFCAIFPFSKLCIDFTELSQESSVLFFPHCCPIQTHI